MSRDDGRGKRRLPCGFGAQPLGRDQEGASLFERRHDIVGAGTSKPNENLVEATIDLDRDGSPARVVDGEGVIAIRVTAQQAADLLAYLSSLK